MEEEDLKKIDEMNVDKRTLNTKFWEFLGNASGKNNRFSKFFQHWMRLIIIGGSLLMRSLVCQNCSYQKFVQHSNTPSKAKILNFKISNISKKFFEISGLTFHG